ncbi:MAG: LysR family transcriptional regulator [Pseudomonadota bacterium]|nr:LysR family transcriptional regulator [Pseudomonadota bacterium]
MTAREPTLHRLNRLKLRQVQLLLALHAGGTLRAAAERMAITQPAATKMLQELEDALGVALFDRAGRGLRWTAAGLRVLEHFGGIEGSLNALARELTQMTPEGTHALLVGAIMAAATDVLTPALLALRSHYPLLGVEIVVDTSDHLCAALGAGKLDVVLGRVAAPDAMRQSDFDFTPLGDEALSIVCGTGHVLSGRSRLRFDDLLGSPWVVQPPGSPMRGVIEREFARHHRRLPPGGVQTASVLTTLSLIQQSDFIAVLPAVQAADFVRHGMLAILAYRLHDALPAFGALTWRHRPPNAVTRHLLALLQSPSLA